MGGIGLHAGVGDRAAAAERTAVLHRDVAAKRAIDSANLAHMLVGTRTISFDMVVRTMYETGISMNRAFRETSEGGLARLYSRRAGTALTRK